MRRATIAIALCAILLVPVYAGTYEKGSTMFVFKAGVAEPAFIHLPYQSENFVFWNSGTHLNLGFISGISYQSFVSGRLALGMQISYAVNTDIYDNSSSLIEIPMSGIMSFYPVHTSKFDIAMSLYGGVDYIRYDSDRYLAPFAMLSVCPVLYVGETWGLGIEAGVTAAFELYGEGNSKRQYSAVYSMLPVSLCVTYRQ